MIAFVVINAVALDHVDEILRTIASQRRTDEMRIARQEIRCIDPSIGEIAASAARNPDLFAQLARMVDKQDASAALTGLRGAHHAGCASADHDDIVSVASAQGSGLKAEKRAGYAMRISPTTKVLHGTEIGSRSSPRSVGCVVALE